uniref:Major facilitator superfamily (MFS) profile domain-containing protein n=1 Tax=Photinus pyralis TaxID=7054 RepID=A0A1Y1KX96_PHOPY
MDDKVATAEKSFKLLLPQTLAAFFVTSLHLLVGQVIAFSGIIVPQLFEDANGTIPITESGGAWIASAPVFSGFAASIVGGMLSDSIGRLNTLMWAGLPGIVGSVLIAMAPNLSMIIWGRAIMGISWMFVSVATPVYISEISHPDIFTCGLSHFCDPAESVTGKPNTYPYLAGYQPILHLFFHWCDHQTTPSKEKKYIRRGNLLTDTSLWIRLFCYQISLFEIVL